MNRETTAFLNGKRQQEQITMQGSARTMTTQSVTATMAAAAAAAVAESSSASTATLTRTNLDYLAQITSLNLQHFLASSIDDQMPSSIAQTPNPKNGNCNSVSTVNPLEEFFAYAVKSDQSEVKPSQHLTSLQIQNEKPILNKNETKTTKPNVRVPIVAEIRTISGPDGSLLYQCSECNEMFADKEILSRHIAGHVSDRKYICDVCGAGLKRKDHLTRHKQSHNPERPYVCEICQKAFKRKEQLSLHFVIHTGIKKHICSECGRGFYRKDHLRKHTKSHISRRMKTALMQTPMTSADLLSSK